MQEPSDLGGGLLRGAEAIASYLNHRLKGGKKLTRAAVYRMVEDDRIPVIRLGQKRSEIWARQCDLDKVFGGSFEFADLA